METDALQMMSDYKPEFQRGGRGESQGAPLSMNPANFGLYPQHKGFALSKCFSFCPDVLFFIVTFVMLYHNYCNVYLYIAT